MFELVDGLLCAYSSFAFGLLVGIVVGGVSIACCAYHYYNGYAK